MEALLAALKAAAEPTRLRLLVLCAHSDLTVSELTHILGQSQPRVSRHLKLLCEAGLLDRRREGSWAYFRLAQRGSGAELARTLVDTVPGDDPTLTLDLERLEAIVRARAERAAAYFRRNAAQWDKIRSLHIDEREVEKALLDLVPPGRFSDLIDIGTGTGRIIEILGPRVERALGIDLSQEMLLVARSNLDRARVRNGLVRQGDMYQLPVASASFDLAVIHQVLHYAETPEAAIAEAARVLRPEGRLIVVDFAAHEVERLRSEHMHRWLGFRDQDIEAWFGSAGLAAETPIYLPGDPLNVVIWCAVRRLPAVSGRTGW
ncbi:MAG: methyltransferase domain-containing protein [Alphaproteobacteria bacterium]|nr:MAG: methyltransferase domain-containing protein [Alphaproteobacteria bacterium]